LYLRGAKFRELKLARYIAPIALGEKLGAARRFSRFNSTQIRTSYTWRSDCVTLVVYCLYRAIDAEPPQDRAYFKSGEKQGCTFRRYR